MSVKLKSPVETFVLRIRVTHLHSSLSLFDAYSDLNKWVCPSIPPTISIKLLKYWHRVLFHSLVCSLIHLYHSLICLPCKARFTRALRCTHSLARSLFHSLPISWIECVGFIIFNPKCVFPSVAHIPKILETAFSIADNDRIELKGEYLNLFGQRTR